AIGGLSLMPSDTGVMPPQIHPNPVALLPTERVTLDRFSDFWQHAREDFEAEVLFVPKSVGPSLDDADLVVDPFNEAQGHLVLLMAIRRDPVPVFLHHAGELLVRLEALPPQGRLPSLEESPRPHLPLVVPQLTEHLLEKVGFVQPPIGLEQCLQRLTPLLRQVGPAGQKCVLLALDEPPVLPREPGVLTLTHLVQGLVQVLEDMELVVEDAGLRRVPRLEGGVAERLPHVHHGQADSLAFPRSQPLEEEVHALLGPVCASEPDRPAADQIADNDTVVLPPADGEFVDADHLRAGRPGPSQLLAHILHLQRLDRLPIEAKFASHIPDRRGPTAAADVVGKPLGVEGVVGQPGQLLLLHGAAAPAAHAPDLDLQVHAGVATREVAHPTGLAVVESSLSPPTRPAGRFFPLRRSRKIRALGSPKMPRTVASGRKPGNRNASSSRRGFRIRVSCRISHLEEKEKTLEIKGFRGHHRQFSTHSVGRRAYLPKAKIVFDHFHVIKLFNEKLSDLRRNLFHQAEDQEKKVLKGIRWLLLKNPENLDRARNEKRRLVAALKLNKPLAAAYYMKEDLRQLWSQANKAQAKRFLKDWIARAEASGIKMLKSFAKTLREHQA